MAALASDAMPDLSVAAVHGVRFDGLRDDPFERAVILDSHGEEYDIAVTDDEGIGVLLGTRARNSSVISRAKESGMLGYRVEHVLAYRQGAPSVLICSHLEGEPVAADLMTDAQCAAVGTAIGALHRMDPSFLQAEGYPQYSSVQIREQFAAWVNHLRRTGRVPAEITTRWHQLAQLDELWEFTSTPVHGGFSDGDFMFGPQGIEAMLNWERLQVNDPARDLAWLFSGILTPAHQDTVLSAYGRLMGSRMDSRIVSRAKLWLQMATVTDFIKALEEADASLIHEYKGRVDELAADLAPIRPPAQDDGKGPDGEPRHARHARDAEGNTVTVGTLLRNGETMALPKSAIPQTDVPTDALTGAPTGPMPTADAHGTADGADASDADDDTDVHPVVSQSTVTGPALGDWVGGADGERPTGYVSLDDSAAADGHAANDMTDGMTDDTAADGTTTDVAVDTPPSAPATTRDDDDHEGTEDHEDAGGTEGTATGTGTNMGLHADEDGDASAVEPPTEPDGDAHDGNDAHSEQDAGIHAEGLFTAIRKAAKALPLSSFLERHDSERSDDRRSYDGESDAVNPLATGSVPFRVTKRTTPESTDESASGRTDDIDRPAGDAAGPGEQDAAPSAAHDGNGHNDDLVEGPVFQPSGNINTAATIMLTPKDLASLNGSGGTGASGDDGDDGNEHDKEGTQ